MLDGDSYYQKKQGRRIGSDMKEEGDYDFK